MTPSLADFEGYRVAHPRLVAADAEVRRHIAHPAGAALLLLIGPTAVGKSTLLHRVIGVVREEHRAEMEEDRSFQPIISVTARTPERGGFDWAGLYADALAELNEPGIEWKVDPERVARREVGRPRAKASDLRGALDRVARARRVRAIVIDEAHHIGMVGSGRRLFEQLEHLKSLADSTGALLVLAGTYQLLTFRNLSGQLSRRSQDVHLRRYDIADAADARIFAALVEHFAGLLPLPLRVTPAVTSLLYEGSLGCVGLLKEWLVRALRDATGQRLTRSDLIATRLPAAALRRAATELTEGELTLDTDDRDLSAVRQLLGVPAGVRAGGATAGAEAAGGSGAGTASGRRRPGRRAPKRDLVGKRRVDVA